MHTKLYDASTTSTRKTCNGQRAEITVLWSEYCMWNNSGVARGQLYIACFFWLRAFGNGIRYCPRQRRAPNAVDGKWMKMIWTPSCLASTQMVLYCWMCEMSVLLESIATPNASRPMPSWCPSQRNWRSHWSLSRGKPVISEWHLTRKALFAEHSLSITHLDDFQHASVNGCVCKMFLRMALRMTTDHASQYDAEV